MFRLAVSFNGNISTRDVSRVIFFGNMFNEASSFNQDLNNWDVSGVTVRCSFFGSDFQDCLRVSNSGLLLCILY